MLKPTLESLPVRLLALWCRWFHRDMWPMNGEVRCRTCFRTRKVW
jgi:hypothetical protein